MILRFTKEQHPDVREESFREFCDMTSRALGVSIENAHLKDVAGPGDYVLVGNHTDPDMSVDLDGKAPIRLDGYECLYIPRAEADCEELEKQPEWSNRFNRSAVNRDYSGIRLHEFLMSEVSINGNPADRYHFVIKIFGND